MIISTPRIFVLTCLQHTCMPLSSHWLKYTQFALWLKNSTDVFRMQDKARFIECLRKEWGNSPVTRLHSWLAIDMDIVCELVTGEIAGKQTTESLPDNTWKRKGPSTDTVCVGRQYVFIPLCTAFASLSPIGTWEDSQRAAVPLKSSQCVCLCQALACFRDYIFSFPFLNSPPRWPQRNSASTSWHTHTHLLVKIHTYALWRRLWEVIRTISCITMNVVWHKKTAYNMIQHSRDNSWN